METKECCGPAVSSRVRRSAIDDELLSLSEAEVLKKLAINAERARLLKLSMQQTDRLRKAGRTRMRNACAP